MLQIDENIGGRQDQKNNGLRTKTLAVGLLMMAGCFVVGYFGATTTTTTTAHTRNVSSPNGKSSQKQFIRKILFKSVSTILRSINSCIFFFSNTTCHSLAPAKSMVWSPIYNSIRTALSSLLQTIHRTRHMSSHTLSMEVLGNAFIRMDLLLPEVHGLHRWEVRVWLQEFLSF